MPKTNEAPPITVALDLDDTLLGTEDFDPSVRGTKGFDPSMPDNNQRPIGDVAARIRSLRYRGIRVVIFTSRKSTSREATIAQLQRAGISYDDIVFDKPQFDVFLDNKAMKFQGTWDAELESALVDEAYENRRLDLARYPMFF